MCPVSKRRKQFTFFFFLIYYLNSQFVQFGHLVEFLLTVILSFPQGGLAYASLWGLANPRSRSQGDRRDKRPAHVSPYVLRREGRRECKASNYGYILPTWPWVVAHPRSWCQGWDHRDKFPGTKVPWGPRWRESHLELPSTVSSLPAGSDVAVHPYGSPTND